MAARRKAKAKAKKCLLCGGPKPGRGGVCASCAGTGAAPTAMKRVARQVRDQIQGGAPGGFICPYCRAELNWDNVKTSEIEVTIYVREKIYFCPGCRAFLGVSSWHTEG